MTEGSMIEDARHEILCCCYATTGIIWPSDVAKKLRLDPFETQVIMEELANTGQLKRRKEKRITRIWPT